MRLLVVAVVGLSACHVASVKLGEEETGMADSGGGLSDPDTGGEDTALVDTGSGDSGDSGNSADTGAPPEPSSCLAYGVTLTESLDLETSGAIDSFDGSGGAYQVSSAGASATVAVNGDSACVANLNAGILHGALWTAGAADVAVCLSWGGSITGAVGVLDAPAVVPSVALPTGLPDSDGDLLLEWGASDTLSGARTVDALTLSTSGRLDVVADATLYVRGDALLSGGGIEVASGAKLDLYVEGALTVEWSGAIRAEDGAPAVTIHVLGTDPVSLGTAGWVDGVLVAPSAAVVADAAGLEGAIFARSLTVDWAGGVHVDERLLCDGS